MEEMLSKVQQAHLSSDESRASLDREEYNVHFKGYKPYGADFYFKLAGKIFMSTVFFPKGKNQNIFIPFVPELISFDNHKDDNAKPQLFSNSMLSKLDFMFGKIIDGRKAEGRLSLSFWGRASEKEEVVNNASCAILRNAYIKLSSIENETDPTFLIGQTTSLFSDSNISLAGTSQIIFSVFQPQFRIAKKVGNTEYALSIENPEADFILRPKKEDMKKGIDNDFKYKTNSGKNGGFGVDSLPDFVFRYMILNKDIKRYFTIRAVLRMLQAKEKVQYKFNDEDKTVFTDSKRMFGFGCGVSFKTPLDDETSLMVNTVFGHGIGRYARMGSTDCMAIFDLESSDFENIKTFVMGAAIERQFSEKITAGLVFSLSYNKYPDIINGILKSQRNKFQKQLSVFAINYVYKLNNATKVYLTLGKGFKTSETNKNGESVFVHIGFQASF